MLSFCFRLLGVEEGIVVDLCPNICESVCAVHHSFSLCYYNLNNLTEKLLNICERETQCRSQIGFNNTLDGHIYTLSNDTGWSKELQTSETNDKGKILKFYQKLHNICIYNGNIEAKLINALHAEQWD